MGFKNEAHYYDLFHQGKNYKQEAEQIKKMFPNAITVLEIGCGTGNLTIELEKLGFKVTGIEPSKEMLKYFKGRTNKVYRTTIQEYIPPKKKYDLVLAMYDVLNYIPESDIDEVGLKIKAMGKHWHAEVWSDFTFVIPFTYRKVDHYHRIRLGFKFKNIAHLWFIFWGKGLVISKHKLYL